MADKYLVVHPDFINRAAIELKVDNRGRSEQENVIYRTINDLLCKNTKDYTSCRKLSQTIQDVSDYFETRLTNEAIKGGINFCPISYETVGSRGEGLGLLANDSDVLCIYNHMSVCFAAEDFEPEYNSMVIEIENCHPGYCRLKFHEQNIGEVTQFTNSDIERKGPIVYLKSSGVVARFQKGNSDLTNHKWQGPALTKESTKQDWVIGFQCLNSLWLYREYLNRPRKWPTVNVLKDLQKTPCSVVCAHHPLSAEPFLEFRISFATSEKFLIRNLSDTQIACYNFLKVIKIRIEEILSEELEKDKIKDVIKTYYMKSVFLWCCEKMNPEQWTDENFLGCVCLCLSQLEQCYSLHILPQLFIPENNLIGHLKSSECMTMSRILKSFCSPINIKNIFGCICMDEFNERFDVIISRPGRNMFKRLHRLLIETSTGSCDPRYVIPHMLSDTLSYVAISLDFYDELIFCPVLYTIIHLLGVLVPSDMIQTISPLLSRILGDALHRLPHVLRSNFDLAEEFYTRGLYLTYTEGNFDDNGFSGKTHLARFHYLNGDYNKALSILSESDLCKIDPIADLSILFLKWDLSRTWRDDFLSEMIKTKTLDDDFSVDLTVRCVAFSLYMTSKCLLNLSKSGILEIKPNKVKRLIRTTKKHENTLTSIYISDITTTVEILRESKRVLSELLTMKH